MKSNIYSTLIGLLLMGLATGCQKTEPLLFDKQYGEATQDMIDEALEVLTSAKYGWEAHYVSGCDSTFVLQFKFDKDYKVTTYADFSEEPSVSSYRFRMSRGAVLSFDTYGLLHRVADPAIIPNKWDESKLGKGYQGDTEFEIIGIAADKVVLRGMKNSRDTTVLVPLERKPDINAEVPYLHRLVRVMNTSSKYFHSIDLAGKPVADFEVREERNGLVSSRCMPIVSVTTLDKDGAPHTSTHTLHPTKGGFRVEPSLLLLGKSYTDFSIDPETDAITSTEEASLQFNLNSDKPLALTGPGKFIPRVHYWSKVGENHSPLFKRQIIEQYRRQVNGAVKEIALGWFSNTDEWRPFYLWAPGNGFTPRVELNYTFDKEADAWLFKVYVPKEVKQVVETSGTGFSEFVRYFTNYFDANTRVYIQDVSPRHDNSVLRFISSKDSRYWFTVRK